jgi:hypothetical protein
LVQLWFRMPLLRMALGGGEIVSFAQVGPQS